MLNINMHKILIICIKDLYITLSQFKIKKDRNSMYTKKFKRVKNKSNSMILVVLSSDL